MKLFNLNFTPTLRTEKNKDHILIKKKDNCKLKVWTFVKILSIPSWWDVKSMGVYSWLCHLGHSGTCLYVKTRWKNVLVKELMCIHTSFCWLDVYGILQTNWTWISKCTNHVHRILKYFRINTVHLTIHLWQFLISFMCLRNSFVVELHNLFNAILSMQLYKANSCYVIDVDLCKLPNMMTMRFHGLLKK